MTQQKQKPIAIDLFSGCGGLSKGFVDAGVDVVLGIDNDNVALETFSRNHGSGVGLNADLSKPETISLIDKVVAGRTVDMVIGGPPCQGFSLTGPRNFDDPRNQLYLSFIRVVKHYRPKAFVIENVPGMATLYNGAVKEEILKRFGKMGYSVVAQIVNAADYGVPQIRRRLIFIGIRKGCGEASFPKPTHSVETYVTSREAIDDLPSLADSLGSETSSYESKPRTAYQRKMRGKCTVLFNHSATRHTKLVQDVISLVPEGGNYKDLPAGVGESRRFHMAWTRCDGHKPSRTIDTGHRNYFHYEYNRIPTIRESARLQSFPDNFVFVGTRTQQSRQVGNAVPPLLGEAIAKHILSILNHATTPTQHN